MGNSESSAPDAGNTIDDFDGIETLGYRVLGVQPNSPASTAGLVSFFDFLIGADGQMLLGSGEELAEGEEYDDVDFPALLEKFKGQKLQLLVWNIKCQEQRLVDIEPSDDWEGAGLLGVTIRLDNYAGAEDRLIRILSVEPNSPAAIAGLVSSQDYLLGTTTHSFDSTKVLAAVLEAHVDRVVELYVYNTNSDKVRVVALMPTWSWGGNGLLGAEVGTGYLHRLPGSCRGTLGGSVERRVRWIGGNKNGPTSPQLQQAAALELEPQLEMEPNHEEEEEDQSVGTVSLASQVSTTPDASAARTNVYQETTQINDSKNETEANGTSQGQAVETPPVAAQPEATSYTEAPPQQHKQEQDEKQPTPSAYDAPAPAPYPIERNQSTESVGSSGNPTITMFIPAAKPPPDSANVKPEDVFSSPPPIAKIPSKTNYVSPAPRSNGSKDGRGRSLSPRPSPQFSTPHPPNAMRSPEDYTGGAPPKPPVEAAASYGGAYAGMPPPPKMSGAH